MTAPLPAQVTLPVIVVVATVTVARWRLVHHTPTDHLINRSLAWVVVGLVLYLRDLAPGSASLMHQLSAGAVMAVLSGIYGVTMMWGGADPNTFWHRQRRYDLVVAVAFAILLVAGTPARRAGLLIDQALGWPAIVFWAAFGTPLALGTARLVWIVARESRSEDLTPREKWVYAAIFVGAGAVFLDALAGPVVAALSTYADLVVDDENMSRKAATFFSTALAAALVCANPVWKLLAARLEWDTDGFHARRLFPLWRDLTADFPHLVLHPAADLAEHTAERRLHRMAIEIHDVLLHLRPYMAGGSRPGGGTPIQEFARVVAGAVAARRGGVPPDPAKIPHAPRLPSSESERQALLALARHWRGATPWTGAGIATSRTVG